MKATGLLHRAPTTGPVRPPTRCVLNVSGSRESKCQGFEQLVFEVMVDVLIKVNPDCRAVYPPI